MRNSLFIILISTIQSLAVTGYAQNTRLTLDMKNSTVKEVLQQIEQQSEFYFLYNSQLIDVQRKIDLTVENETIDVILNQVFSDGKVDILVRDRHIVLTANGESVSQQSHKVTGKVTDASGATLPGVSVVVKGTTTGTITDSDGKFTLSNFPGNATLQFSFVGMKTQEIAVAGKTSFNVTLAEDAIGIEEVVAVGYGTTSQKKLTTAATHFKSEKMESLPISNIADAFSGQLSGVLADNNSGTPGAAPVIRIRGYGSINAGSEPLYVIDGMIATATQFGALNPKSVESVDVLKDAAAGAIFGSRAGNGVVIVTTKKGKTGQAKFSYNSTFGIQEVTKKVDVLDRDQFLSLVKESYSNDKKALPDFYNQVPSSYANTNWQDEIFRKSSYQNHQLSASGGSDKVKYFLAGNILDNEGIIKTTYQKNYSANGNFEIDLKKNLQVGLTFNASHIKERVNGSINNYFGHSSGAYGVSGGIMQQALWMSPIVPVYLANGDYGQQTQGDFAPFFPAGYANPVNNLNETYDVYSRNNVMGRTFLNYEPISGLSFNLSFSGNLSSYIRDYHTSPYLSGVGSPKANFSNPVYGGMSAGQENGMVTSATTEGYVDYKKTFATDHKLDLMAGFSRQINNTRSTAATSSSNDRGTANALKPIPAYDNYYRPNIYGAAMVLGSGNYGANSFESVFSRINYSYKDKYIFMGSVRRDGSSKFAPDGRWGIFPAFSGAWRVSEENFLKKLAWISDFKLRASYGVSGNDQIGNYSWQGTVGYNNLYTYAPTSMGGAGTGKLVEPNSIENKKLKWETNEQNDIGIDLSLFKSRISITADYFVRNTKDMLLYRALPLENGIAASILDNIGNMSNKGIEMSLNAINVKTKDFSWTTDLNITKIKNKVEKVFTSTGDIKLSAGATSGFESAIRIVEGHEMFEIYTYKVLGVFETQEQINTYPRANNAMIGDPMIEDYNKDGKINTDDLQPVGKALPEYTYGITNTFKYRSFDLNILIDGSQGASKVVTALRQAALMRNAENTLVSWYDDRYIQGQTGHHFAPASTGVTGARHWNQSYFIYDASFVRIKNVVLGYNLNKNLCSKMKMEDLRFTLGVQNLFTFTKYPLWNPQANSNDGQPGTAQFGVDLGQYPLSRIYTVGINITF